MVKRSGKMTITIVEAILGFIILLTAIWTYILIFSSTKYDCDDIEGW